MGQPRFSQPPCAGTWMPGRITSACSSCPSGRTPLGRWSGWRQNWGWAPSRERASRRGGIVRAVGGWSEGSQAWGEVAFEQGHESFLIVAGSVEDEMGESPVHVLLDLSDHLIRVGADDPPPGDLFDGQGIRGPLHLDRIGDVV